MSPELDPLYVLDELASGNDIDCPNCLSNINIVGPNVPKDNEPFSFQCPYCDKELLELTRDGASVYLQLRHVETGEEAEKINEVIENLDNLLNDDEVEELKNKLEEVRDRIS